MPNNSILVIKPYVWNGAWVFDDESVGLKHEALIAGVPEVIRRLTKKKRIPTPEQGFSLYFSANPFPGYDLKADWLEEEYSGNWYYIEESEWKNHIVITSPKPEPMKGWLCPALFNYFEKAPKNLYIKAESL